MTSNANNIDLTLPAEDSTSSLGEEALREAIKQLRACQLLWSQRSITERLAWAERLAEQIAAHADELTQSIYRPASLNEGELLASEVLPLAEACRYAARRGAQVLAPIRFARRDGAWWMGRVAVEQQRLPWGLVLVIGPSNYPLLLPGVQLVQAVAAGNGVLVKPAPRCESAMITLKQCCIEAGMPEQLVHVLSTEPVQVQRALEHGIDKVIFTGSYKTGQTISRSLVESMTPAAMELSGNDAVIVLDSADLTIAAKSIAYALDMNGGQTCIAPRRLFCTAATRSRLMPLLAAELTACQPRSIAERGAQAASEAIAKALDAGAQVSIGTIDRLANHQAVQPIVLSGVRADMQIANEDLFAPILSVMEVSNPGDAVVQANRCRYALGASVFGESVEAAVVAGKLDVGCVTINDCLVPTADPRVSFGGWRSSGFGVTRGLEGLRELTQLKVTCQRRGRWLPHLSTDGEQLAGMMRGILLLRHGATWRQRIAGFKFMIRAGRKSK